MSADLFPHVGVLTNLGGTLMVGSMKSTTYFTTQGEANPTAVHTGLADISQTLVVPEVDGKIALAYQTEVGASSLLMAQLGYSYTVYFNGVNQVMPAVLVPDAFNDGTIAIETQSQVQSNLNLSGPFFQLSWIFNT